jgi:Ca2+-binding EF-hand superfamily protein
LQKLPSNPSISGFGVIFGRFSSSYSTFDKTCAESAGYVSYAWILRICIKDPDLSQSLTLKTLTDNAKAMSRIAQPVVWIGFLLISIFVATPAIGQQFDLESYLKRKDVNGNNKVEPEEMSGNVRKIISESGLKSEKTYSIPTIVKYYNRAKGKMESSKSRSEKQTARLVPGFGTETESKTAISPFGSGSSSTTSGGYSKSVNERVHWTLDRYDGNKNGMLDADEIKRTRWGSPDPRTSDLNKDGKLSRDELAKRYSAREKISSSSSSSRSSRSSKTESSDDKRKRLAKEREKFRNSGSTGSSSTSRSYSSASTKASSSTPDRAKFDRYAESLIKNYDKDEDGKLSKDEIKKMRRPPVGADTDKDGFISKTELSDNLSGVSKGKSDSKSSSSKTSSKRSYSSSRSRSSSSPSSSFEKLDADSDRQVFMHEYTDKWTDEKVIEFYKIDKNGDGVITMTEWNNK